jgi:oligoendopeptidase F
VKSRTIVPEPSSAAGVRWDLSRIFVDVAAARVALADAVGRAAALEARAADIDSLDPAGLRDLLDEASALAELRDVLSEEWGYGALRLLADQSDAEARDLVAESEEALATVRDGLRAVALRVGARPSLAEVPELAPYRHWLEHQAALAARRLDAGAEKAFAARAPSASTAWGRLSQEILTAASVPLDSGAGEQPHSRVELRLLRYHADRDVRRRAATALLGIYEASLPVAAACLDAVVADRLSEDRLRGREDPMEATLAVDEVDPATVERLLTAVESRTDILARWFQRKELALEVEPIESYDRLAPVGDVPSVSWPDAVNACCAVFDELSTSLGDVARGVFDARAVDAERRPGKDGGVFCAPFPSGYGTYVFLNYLESGAPSSLAHELGHAVHFELANKARPWLATIEPDSAAFFEVPSMFAQLATAERLCATIGGEGGKALIRSALEGVFALIFSAAVRTRFEQDACARRASGQALTPERIDEIWLAREHAVFGRLTERLGIMHAPHVFDARFYGYQYMYATLAALCLAALRRADPERFARDYVAMLEATGTGSPNQLLARCGLDVEDPDVWRQGFAELDRLCELAW